MSYEVVGYPLCPFVQRVLITLNHKGVAYKERWLDPHGELPEWFKEWSPLGRVPVMKDEKSGTILFESMVLVELIEEEHPEPSIYPKEAAERGLTRAWASIAGEMYGPQYMTMRAKSEEEAEPHFESLRKSLSLLERECVGEEFFNGVAFSAIDLVLAPMFIRFEITQRQGGPDLLAPFPKLAQLSRSLIANSAVAKTIEGEWRAQFIANMAKNGGYLFKERP